jgi:hypothetical protein
MVISLSRNFQTIHNKNYEIFFERKETRFQKWEHITYSWLGFYNTMSVLSM